MVVVIFEFEVDPAKAGRYFELATLLHDEVEKVNGFVSVRRFENINEPGCFVSISTWENLEAARDWKEHVEHSSVQQEAKSTGIFRRYRIRVADVIRDYCLE